MEKCRDIVDEVGEDCMAVSEEWDFEAGKVGRRDGDDAKVGMVLVEVPDDP